MQVTGVSFELYRRLCRLRAVFKYPNYWIIYRHFLPEDPKKYLLTAIFQYICSYLKERAIMLLSNKDY